jgi:hypothetical protein
MRAKSVLYALKVMLAHEPSMEYAKRDQQYSFGCASHARRG